MYGYPTSLPALIDAPGLYRTRAGETVIVSIVGRSIWYADCWGNYLNGIEEHWNSTGRIFPGTESQNDIVAKR